MMQALWTAATGMRAQEFQVNTIANNLANVNTTGFKKDRVDFQDLLYLVVRPAGIRTTEGTFTPAGIYVGEGVKIAATQKIFTQGSLVDTGRRYDVAIEGEGLFAVELPDGGKGYTRDGSFKIDGDGNLVTADGYMLSPPVQIPFDTTDIVITEDGRILSKVGNQLNPDEVGRIRLVRFPNSSGLESVGRNLMLPTPASGDAFEGTPGEDGFGRLAQGFLENSNVNVVTEMVDLIVAQRAYELNTKAIQSSDDMLALANGLKR